MNKDMELLISAQTALLGAVGPSLRGAAVKWIGNTIMTYFYHDGPITPEIEDDYRCVGTEIVADFDDADIQENIIRCDFPQKLPFENFRWIYRRKEVLPE